jgi:hypothetical protein
VSLVETKDNHRSLLKLLRGVIPCLSSYLQVDLRQDAQAHEIFDSEIDLSGSFRHVDSTKPFMKLLTEKSFTQRLLVTRVKHFLGSIGGLMHMVVDATHDLGEQDLVSWDYEAPLTFPLPLGNRKVDIRIGHLLPRVLAMIATAQKEKAKVVAGELLHSVLTFLIGKSASLRNDAWK